MSPISPQNHRRRGRPPGPKPWGIRPDAVRIFALIDEAEVTVAEFASRVGCHPQTLWNIKSGNTPRVSPDLLSRIAAAGGVRADEIALDELAA